MRRAEKREGWKVKHRLVLLKKRSHTTLFKSLHGASLPARVPTSVDESVGKATLDKQEGGKREWIAQPNQTVASDSESPARFLSAFVFPGRKVFNRFPAGCWLSHGLGALGWSVWKDWAWGHPIPASGRKCSRYCENSAITGSAGGIFPAFHRAIGSSGGILTQTKTSRQHFFQRAKCSFNRSRSLSWALLAESEALSPSTRSARQEVRHLNINRGRARRRGRLPRIPPNTGSFILWLQLLNYRWLVCHDGSYRLLL